MPKNPQLIGWAIGKGEAYTDTEYQDQVEADALYDLLERDVVPAFYERGADRLPRRWIERMKSSIGALCHFVNTHRMVGDYMCGYYFRAHSQFRAVDQDGAARSRALASWLEHVRREWPHVKIAEVKKDTGVTMLVGASMRVQARIQLAGLRPDDVAVELYLGKLDALSDIVEPVAERMSSVAEAGNGTWLFEATSSCAASGLHGYTVRVRPNHADLFTPFVPGLITWAT